MDRAADSNTPADPTHVRVVSAGSDCFDQRRGLGVSRIDFKVAGVDSPELLVLENVFHAKGGPARHLHYDQDEWFYVLESDFVMEIGDQRFHLRAGDSLMAPRGLPHVWAHVGNATGRVLVSFAPAGLMESFFRIVTAHDAMPPLDPELWRRHGMELVGPPLAVD